MLIAKHSNFEVLKPIGKQNGSSSHPWLIHIPAASGNDQTYLAKIFQQTPLRLDSNVFAFYEDNGSETMI